MTLRGGLVNVSLNGSVIASKLFNESVTQGQFGLISLQGTTSGQTSFDNVQAKTDEAAYGAAATGGSPLMAVYAPSAPAPVQPAPTPAQLSAGFIQARRRLADTGLYSAAALAQLDGVTLQAADLDGLGVGQTLGNIIFIDNDAAGFGWFLDSSLADDREFQLASDGALHATSGPAAGRMDLLSVLAHEMGHVMGLEHSEGGVMEGTLTPGTRTIAAPTPTTMPTAVDAVSLIRTEGITLRTADFDAPEALPSTPVGQSFLGKTDTSGIRRTAVTTRAGAPESLHPRRASKLPHAALAVRDLTLPIDPHATDAAPFLARPADIQADLGGLWSDNFTDQQSAAESTTSLLDEAASPKGAGGRNAHPSIYPGIDMLSLNTRARIRFTGSAFSDPTSHGMDSL